MKQRGERPSEEFIETIPFSETRTYVMIIILAAREQYRRLYGLGRAAAGPAIEDRDRELPTWRLQGKGSPGRAEARRRRGHDGRRFDQVKA
ncbi:MAG: hypothetical protein U0599_09200 [Vicinamibacteria bacterium]